MPREHTIARFQQLFERWKPRAVKTPVRMLGQLLIALVARVRGKKESLRIAGVNENRNPETPAFVPDRIQPRIVDREQLSGLIAHSQTQVLQKLESASAAGDGIVHQLHHLFTEIRVVDL